jgi:hypothetical protein
LQVKKYLIKLKSSIKLLQNNGGNMAFKTFKEIADHHLASIGQINTQKQRIVAEQIKASAGLLKTATQDQALTIIANLAMLQTELRS